MNAVEPEQGSAAFQDNVREALKDTERARLRDMLGVFMPMVRSAAVDQFDKYEELRQHVKNVKQHSLDNLHH